MIAGLVFLCITACVWLSKAERHSVSEMAAATLALSSLFTVVLVGIGVAG